MGTISAAPNAAAPSKRFHPRHQVLCLSGLAGKLAAIVGPLSYGLITYLTAGNHRLAILSTVLFFVVGLLPLATVNKSRGTAAAMEG